MGVLACTWQTLSVSTVPASWSHADCAPSAVPAELMTMFLRRGRRGRVGVLETDAAPAIRAAVVRAINTFRVVITTYLWLAWPPQPYRAPGFAMHRAPVVVFVPGRSAATTDRRRMRRSRAGSGPGRQRRGRRCSCRCPPREPTPFPSPIPLPSRVADDVLGEQLRRSRCRSPCWAAATSASSSLLCSAESHGCPALVRDVLTGTGDESACVFLLALQHLSDLRIGNMSNASRST